MRQRLPWRHRLPRQRLRGHLPVGSHGLRLGVPRPAERQQQLRHLRHRLRGGPGLRDGRVLGHLRERPHQL
ncbi:MAG: hypothetical protein ACK55I_15960, partial [bacterium]